MTNAIVKTAILKTDVPAASRLHAALHGSHFADCYRMRLDGDPRTALELYLQSVARAPRWVEWLMAVRNGVVARLGLKDLGALGAIDAARPAASYRAGDRVGIFTLLHVADDEVILGDSDRHLDVQVSVCKLAGAEAGDVAISTVVHVRRTLGHVYMLFVAPVHRRIVPAVMGRLTRGGQHADNQAGTVARRQD